MPYYSITHDDRPVGEARVSYCGLYAEIVCRVDIPCSISHRVIMHMQDATLDLGILIPVQNSWEIHTKKPRKYLGGEIIAFTLENQSKDDPFRPISADAPFEALADVVNSKLEFRNGIPGIVVEQTLTDQ